MRHVAAPLAGLALAVLDTASATLTAQDQVTAPVGCYDITVGDWYVAYAVPNEPPRPLPDEGGDSIHYEIPPRIEFVGPLPSASVEEEPDSERRIVVPEGALPSVHRFMSGRIAGDSLALDPWGNPDIEVVTRVELWYPREDYQRLSARFREMFGSPDQDAPEESEPWLRWRNRVTELELGVTERHGDDVLTLVSLWARFHL